MTEFASYLMYPKVFLDYAARSRATIGDVSVLPTPVFFYGMEPGEEVSVDIERGKTLIVRFVAVSEPHEDGTRTVFFELNGQPRSVQGAGSQQVALNAAAPQGRAGQSRARRRADAGHGGDRRGQAGRRGGARRHAASRSKR